MAGGDSSIITEGLNLVNLLEMYLLYREVSGRCHVLNVLGAGVHLPPLLLANCDSQQVLDSLPGLFRREWVPFQPANLHQRVLQLGQRAEDFLLE